jgi:DNA-binding response OmpR family regulator
MTVETIRSTGRNVRILVADEPADWAKTFFDRLNSPAIDVLFAGSERQGLEIIRREPVDLALIAGDVPQVGGLEFIRRVRWYRAEMPVIVLGGEASRRWMLEALRVGVRTVIPRPVNVPRLVEFSIKMLGTMQRIDF